MLIIIGFLILLIISIFTVRADAIDRRDRAIEQAKLREQREGYCDAIC